MSDTRNPRHRVSEPSVPAPRRRWLGLMGWGIGRRLVLAALLLAAIWSAVFWALI